MSLYITGLWRKISPQLQTACSTSRHLVTWSGLNSCHHLQKSELSDGHCQTGMFGKYRDEPCPRGSLDRFLWTRSMMGTVVIAARHSRGTIRILEPEKIIYTLMSRNMRFHSIWYVWPAKAQTSLYICAVWSEPLLVAWIFNDIKATDRTSFRVSKLERGLLSLVWVYTCQNATLLEITAHFKIISLVQLNSLTLGKFLMLSCRLRIFFKINFFKNLLSGIPSECQTVWILIRPNVKSGLIWI